MTDRTNDPIVQSWVASANGHEDFPIQNLPLGVFSPPGGVARVGVAIGDSILDLSMFATSGIGAAVPAETLNSSSLNALLALPGDARTKLRAQLFDLLADEGRRSEIAPLLHDASACEMHLPAVIGDYTDFFAGIHHATNTGKMFRPDNPLLPNYKYVPVGYHGRASSIRPSGLPARRPNGQRKPAAETVPTYGPSRNLDYEMELGVWIGAGNALGEPIPIGEAEDHIAGFCLLNDWSARDVQGWEYQPLGPFLAKSFHTTISPWIVTPDALAPFRRAQQARPTEDPAPLPYLLDAEDQARGGLDIELEVLIETEQMRTGGIAPHRLSIGNARDLYWTVAQLVTHQTSAGCDLRPGDLFGSGTISGATPDSLGSLLELTEGGRKPIALPSGETRRFLEDGDEIVMRGRCRRDGAASIGFGECRGRILPAPQPQTGTRP
jgi:fumarylacetoacetase